MLGCLHIVHPSDGRVVRCRLYIIGVFHCLVGNAPHYIDETVERVLALHLCRFYHRRFVEEQREVDGGRMITVIKQSFGHIHCGDTRRLVSKPVKDELMFAKSLNGQAIQVF